MNFSFQSVPGKRSSAEPLRIAILGDFGGQPSDQRSFGPVQVDFDNFDEVFERIGVSLDLPACPERPWEIKLRFRNLDDFHPEQLLRQSPPLSNLVELRTRLLHPASMDAAAKELQETLKIAAPVEPPAASSSTESTEELLGRLLGKPTSEPGRATSPAGIADRLIKQIVGGNAPNVHPQQSQLIALAESELSVRLRAILHNPSFQALEAAWRGLDFMVRNLAEEVRLYVINICQSDFVSMLPEEDLARSPIYKQLEKIRAAVVLGVYTFGPEDPAVLAGIARLANAGHIGFLAGASPQLVGCSSFGAEPDPDDWKKASLDAAAEFTALRRMPEAVHLGLAMPRFLLRQPYGKGSDAIEAFPFEEMPAKPDHESYLWGNPAFLCGHLLAEEFSDEGSGSVSDGGGGEVSGLPVHTFTVSGQTEVKPCAEAWLSERAAHAILSRGIMPILSIQGRDAVKLLTLRALSDPPAPLALGLESET